MYVYSIDNIYIESCIPLDSFANATVKNRADVDRYFFEKYCGGGSTDGAIADVILQTLCKDFVTCFPLRYMKCGWKLSSEIKDVYLSITKLGKENKKK